MKITNPKTIEMTVEVVTRSVVKIVVDADENVSLDRYGDIGKAIFDATPAEMFVDVERCFERVSFCSSSAEAEIAATLDDGKAVLSKYSDTVELQLADSGDLDEVMHYVFHAGNDLQGRPVITKPVDPKSVTSVVAKVTPFTPEKQKIVLERIREAFLPDSLPNNVEIVVKEFDEQETKWMKHDENYAEVALTANVRRSDCLFCEWDAFSTFAYGMYGEDPRNLKAGDIRSAVDSFMEGRTLKTLATV
ncbi:TPA: hypothetical protein ACKQHR_001549 [Pseudomonas aeruginosa]